MKIFTLLFFSLLLSNFSKAQVSSAPERQTLLTSQASITDYTYRDFNVLPAKADTIHPVGTDTAKHNFYGNLINNDSIYNKKYPLWQPALEVIGINLLTMGMDRYLLKADYAKVSLNTWGYNLRKGWEWDVDGFGINFFGHPYSGSLTFNTARSDGYNYYQSVPFALGGSLLYEYFGENTRPSYNDVINTTLTGAFLGEILYRLSSNVLDDRKTGGERVLREIGAGILDPARGLNRLIQGKSFRVVPHEIYQKEPVNFTFYAGVHNTTDVGISTKTNSLAMLNMQIDYGNPFEPRRRKPFDIFRVRVDFDYGTTPVVDNIGGYGVLFGQNIQTGKLISLVGGFQYYDYWHNRYFEMASAGLGGGIISKLPLSTSTNLFTSLHFAAVPLAANAIDYGLDTFSFKRYRYGAGFEAKFESSLNLGTWGSISVLAYYYWTHSYVRAPQTNVLAVLRPRLTLQLYKQLSVGVEDFVYYNEEYFPTGIKRNTISLVRSEQKIFLIYFLEDSKRYEHYN